MPNFSGMATTFDIPNYGGELFLITPTDTPLLRAMGGLQQNGADLLVNSTEYTWQTEDLAVPQQPGVLEGANASFSERTRANFSNVVQIFQYGVSVTYTKLAANQQLAAISPDANPVQNELDHQINLKLITAARDINYTFLNGVYNKPSDNTTPRKTRGLNSAITTAALDVQAAGQAFTVAASNDTFTANAHGYVNGQQVRLSGLTGANGVAASTIYYVINAATNTFKLAATSGGAAIDVTVDGSGTVKAATALAKASIDAMLDTVWTARGINQDMEPTLIVNSFQKRMLTKIYITDANYREITRDVGGVSVQTIETDFGTLNILMDRAQPSDVLTFTHLQLLKPKFLLIPQKGFLFVEPLSKSGASENYQLYGEVGLEYGDEGQHGKITGLTTA
ncbi:MAG TPA: DUF5309 family protein [Kouleothrix sp.]|nr:DUF5309 family protein [Kouleothrix sp.]